MVKLTIIFINGSCEFCLAESAFPCYLYMVAVYLLFFISVCNLNFVLIIADQRNVNTVKNHSLTVDVMVVSCTLLIVQQGLSNKFIDTNDKFETI